MRRLMLVAAVCAGLVLGGTVGRALALDCHGRLVVIGQRPWEVQERCGEPSEIDHVTKYLPQQLYDPFQERSVLIVVPVEQSIWTYNFGPTRLIYILTFQEGKLIDITTGGYGR